MKRTINNKEYEIKSFANLRKADLSGANLSGAKLDDVFYQISRIGSENRMTTWNKSKNIVWCGCFTGTLEEFEENIKKTHKTKSVHRHNYLRVVNYFLALK